MTFFLQSAGECCSTDRRAGTGMRLGEFCTLRWGDCSRDLAGAGVAGVVGDAGAEGQSSDRLSSHGWLIFGALLICDTGGARHAGSHQ